MSDEEGFRSGRRGERVDVVVQVIGLWLDGKHRLSVGGGAVREKIENPLKKKKEALMRKTIEKKNRKGVKRPTYSTA